MTRDYKSEVKAKDAVRIVRAGQIQAALIDEKRRSHKAAVKETKRRKDELERARDRLEWINTKPEEGGTPLLDLMDGQAWRHVPLPHAISPGIAEKIETDLGFRTLGELQDWQREEGGRLEETVGDERAAIANAEVLQFFIDHPEYTNTEDDEKS